jgi:hypothetical protein
VALDSNHWIGNRAAEKTDAETAIGGALAVNRVVDLHIVNNVLAGNIAHGGAALLLVGGTLTPTGNVTVANNTLYANIGDSGINLRLWTTPITLTNNLVVSHTMGIEVESGAAALRYILYSSNTQDAGGAGSIDEQHAITGTPAFVDAASGDFHLRPESDAVNAGDPAGVPPAPATDIEGTPRPFGPRVDIGAYEWHQPQRFLPFIGKPVIARSGWAVGDDAAGIPAIVHTVDGGQTWVRQAGKPAWAGLDAGDISAVDDQTAWAAFVSAPGEARDAILYTTNGGATWISQTLPAGVTGGVKSIKGVSRSEAWASTLTGVVLHTVDGGATWAIVPHPGITMTQVNRLDVDGPQIWIADSAQEGAIVHSADGGVSWRTESMTSGGNVESRSWSMR